MGFTPGTGGGSSSLAGSTDVALNSVQDNQFLSYDSASSKWYNAEPVSTSVDYATVPPGSSFTISWHNDQSEWRVDYLNGPAITARPSDRTDISFHYVGGTVPPTWAVAGDIHTSDAA